MHLADGNRQQKHYQLRSTHNMQIPVGNFGNAIADAPPSVRVPPGAFSQGQGLEKLGNTAMSVAADLHAQDIALKRAQSANNFQDYRIAENSLRLNLGIALADGTLSSSDAQTAYTSGLSDIPKPDTMGLDPVTAENVARGTQQVQTEGQNSLVPMIKGAQVLEQKSTLDLGMDKIGKLAGMPGADVAKELAALNAHDGEGIKAYGKNWAKVKQDFIDRTWFDAAGANIERNSASMTALQAIQADLKDPNGSYADKLDIKARTELLYKVENQIHGTIIDANNARVIAEREKAQAQDQIMMGYLARTVAGNLTVSEVLKNHDLTFEQQLHMKNIIEAQSNKMDRTDARVFEDTFNRIHAAPGAPNAITSPDQLYPLVGHGLSVIDMAKLRSEVDLKNQPEGELLTNFKKMARDQIDASTLFGKDPVGAENFYKWNAYFDQQFAEQRKAGKSPHDLLSPTDAQGKPNKDYLGNTINGYTRTLAQQTADMAATMGGAKPVATGVQMATPKTKAEFDALPSGTKFINPADGKQYVKK
jgi:hypothetical protein